MSRRRRPEPDGPKQPYRQILMLAGLTLLAVIAISLTSPQTIEQIKAWQETIMGFFVPVPTP